MATTPDHGFDLIPDGTTPWGDRGRANWTKLDERVAFVVGNTIRMDIHNRREEIEVMALVGATGGFIRRPFLYSGLWYGLAGGLLAWVLVRLGLAILAGPVEALGGTYDSEFGLRPLSGQLSLALVLGSGALGVIGSWLAVDRHLRRIHL